MCIMQRFHFEDPRLDEAVARMKRLGAEEFETTATFCFTPKSEGTAPHHTSPPKDPMYFADFRARMTERQTPAQWQKAVA